MWFIGLVDFLNGVRFPSLHVVVYPDKQGCIAFAVRGSSLVALVMQFSRDAVRLRQVIAQQLAHSCLALCYRTRKNLILLEMSSQKCNNWWAF